MQKATPVTTEIPKRRERIVVSSRLPQNAADILACGDGAAQSTLARRFPDLFVAAFAEGVGDGAAALTLNLDVSRALVARCVALDESDLNATELFNWFTRNERFQLALRFTDVWQSRGLAVDGVAVLAVLAGCTRRLAGAATAPANPASGLADVAAALAFAAGADTAETGSAPCWVQASEATGFAVVELEAQASELLDTMAAAPDALGYGALTLARHPSVGEPGVSCNRTLINVLCGDCRARAHHNALDTLRNRLQSGQLRATEMLDHVLSAIKHCGGVRRVHLLEADLAAGVLRSRRRLHVRGAVPLQPLEVAMGSAPALESLMLVPQTRVVSPDAVHPDVAALAESPLLPARHSIVGSLLVGNRPQGVVVADAEGLPISAADADRVNDLIQLCSKLLSLLTGENEAWRQARARPTRAHGTPAG
ncbi:MAG: hypothetical protein AAGA11_13745 [Pseudomonadota bacterium]